MRLTLPTRLAALSGGAGGGGSGGGGNRLKRLRQLTGRSLLDCRKALAACGHNVDAAADWLKKIEQTADEPQKSEKKQKKQLKPAQHGLLGVTVFQQQQKPQNRRQPAPVNQSTAVVVELRCQTQFAARNQLFQQLLTAACQAFLSSLTGSDGDFALSTMSTNAVIVPPERLLSLSLSAGKFANEHQQFPLSSSTIADALAETAKRIGERLTLARGLAFSAPAGAQLAVYCHPMETWQSAGPHRPAMAGRSFSSSPVAAGPHSHQSAQLQPPAAPIVFARYAAGVAYKLLLPNQGARGAAQAAEAGRRLAQHVVGMRPKWVGPSGRYSSPATDHLERDNFNERQLELQPFLLDEQFTAGDWAAARGIRVVDFFRAQSGPASSVLVASQRSGAD